jgi:uncharacterized membrane protein YqjE
MPPLREAAALLNDAVSNRKDLAAIELAEARGHAGLSALLAGVVAVFIFLGGLMLTLTIAGLVWDSPHRTWWLAGISATCVGGAAIAVLALRRRLRAWQPFGEIRRQLQLDHQCLSQLIQAILP